MPRTHRTCPARSPSLRQLARGATLSVLLGLPGASIANEAQLWSVHAFGLKVGELKVETKSTSVSYSGSGVFKTTGLAGALRRIRFSIFANGRTNGARLFPAAYDGFIDTGRRISETKLRFRGDVPIKTAGDQAPETPIKDAAKRGALDPMTMMLLSIRNQTDATLCSINQTQYDGTRLVRITLQTRTSAGNEVICLGTYDRIGGYSAEELDELKTSPLSITYTRAGDIWRATEIQLTSRHGKAKLRRQE